MSTHVARSAFEARSPTEARHREHDWTRYFVVVGRVLFAAIFVTTLLLADLHCFYIVMALVCLVWLSGVGAWDDRWKLASARNKSGTREGLHSSEKLLFQLTFFSAGLGGLEETTDRHRAECDV